MKKMDVVIKLPPSVSLNLCYVFVIKRYGGGWEVWRWKWGPLVGGRLKKVVVGRRRYNGVMVVEEVEGIKWIIWIMEPGILRIISTDDSNEVRIFGSWEESVELVGERVEKVVVGKRRYGGVMVEEDVE
nr:hypothetical protein [Tanacetum cinerariifolium]